MSGRRRIPPERLDHIGIAVRSLEQALGPYVDGLGLAVEGSEEVAGERVRVAFLPVGETRIELLEATADDSPVARFIERRGEGIHHLCFRVRDLEAALAGLRDAGVPLVDDTPRSGAGGSRVAFVHPRGTGGVLIELVEAGEP
jgi:methylmalonyl-CoA/ethylmalonyl-CoA epimerase